MEEELPERNAAAKKPRTDVEKLHVVGECGSQTARRGKRGQESGILAVETKTAQPALNNRTGNVKTLFESTH